MNVSKALQNVFVENPTMQTSNKRKDNSISRFYTLKCQFVPQPKPRASLLPEAQVQERRHDRHFKAQPETVVYGFSGTVFALFVGSGTILAILHNDIFKIGKVFFQQTVEDIPQRFASSKDIRARLKKKKNNYLNKMKFLLAVKCMKIKFRLLTALLINEYKK